MHSEPDVTRIVRSWLRTDEHESADRVLDDVLGLLDATPQRRSWWPAWRIADMNTYAKLGIAAAAVVVVAVVGINLLPGSGGIGGGGPVASPSVAPSPAPASSPTPQPSPSAPAAIFPPTGKLAVGTRHQINGVVPYSFTVPTSDWVSNGEWGIDKGTMNPDGAGFILWPDGAPVGVYADPCAHVQAPPIGAEAAKLAAAVAALPGTDLVSGPSDVKVGGYPAKLVVITFPDDADCNADGKLGDDEFYLWYAAIQGNARWASELGSTMRVWIVDVGGKIVWIDGETFKGAGSEPGKAIQQIVDSIQFE
jgi:hypothetical protein